MNCAASAACFALVASGLLALPALAGDGVPALPSANVGQQSPVLAADGSGGAWLAFKTSNQRHAIVHVLPVGAPDPAWPNGLVDHGLGVDLGRPTRMAADAAGRVYLFGEWAWANDTVATGFGLDGDTLSGFPITTTHDLASFNAVTGADGRVLFAYEGTHAYGSGLLYGIYSGSGQREYEGSVSCAYQVIEAQADAVRDGAGGMIVGLPLYYASDYSTGSDIGVIRLAPDGTRPWGDSGKPVCWVPGHQTALRLWPDGAGGVLMSWTDARTSPPASPQDIYAARLDASGNLVAGWTAQGKRVAAAAGAQLDSRIVDDGAGGAWILWRDQRVTDLDLYFTHVLGNGAFAPGFSNLGTLLCGATGTPLSPQMAPDGAGGFFAVWIDVRNGQTDVYGTHITAAGVPAAGWPADGLGLCDAASFAETPVVASIAPHQAIVAWRDLRVAGGRIFTLALGAGGPIVLDVPAAVAGALRLRAARHPTVGLPDVLLSAGAGEPVRVQLVDVAGRVVRDVLVPSGPGETAVRFGGAPVPPGVYFASARRGAERAVLRVCVLR